MKNNIKKILAGAVALTLFLGNFTGIGITVVKAESREMPVYVIDEESDEPVAGIYLVLESTSEAAEDIIFDDPTDEDGFVLYEPLTLKSGVVYNLKPAKDSDCTCSEMVEVVGGRNYYGNYIETVNGKEYDGEDIDLFVQDNRDAKPVISEIYSISSSIEEVSRDGGMATITVNGKNLPEEVYYQLSSVTSTGLEDLKSEQKVAMTGNDAQKQFTLDIPSAVQSPDVVRWVVRVSLDGGAQGWDAVRIKIEDEAR